VSTPKISDTLFDVPSAGLRAGSIDAPIAQHSKSFFDRHKHTRLVSDLRQSSRPSRRQTGLTPISHLSRITGLPLAPRSRKIFLGREGHWPKKRSAPFAISKACRTYSCPAALGLRRVARSVRRSVSRLSSSLGLYPAFLRASSSLLAFTVILQGERLSPRR